MLDGILNSSQAILTIAHQNMWIALIVYMLLHTIFALLLLPCSLFTFLAGSIWGIWPGLFISSFTAMIPSGITFLIGRKLRTRNATGYLINSKLVKKSNLFINKIIGTGWPAIVIVQGNPFVPASSTGYLFGYKGVRPSIFFITTYLSILPLQTVIVASGTTAYDAIYLQEVHGSIVFLMMFSALLMGILIYVRLKMEKSNLVEGAGDEKS